MGREELPAYPVNLVFTNQSLSFPAPRVVIWQDLRRFKPTFFNVAWKVISCCGYGWRRPLDFAGLEVSFEDSLGNHTIRQAASSGDGLVLLRQGPRKVCGRIQLAQNSDWIEFRNGSDSDVCRAVLWRGSNRIGCTSFLRPGDSSSCLSHSRIRLGVVPEAQEDAVLSEDIMDRCRSELALKSITSASLVMMGGGWGAKATAFSFHLLDLNKAGFHARPTRWGR
jgi:hypothetical protein